jgi:HPt (histidine-containing phosphotransfer) domain-containing protein
MTAANTPPPAPQPATSLRLDPQALDRLRELDPDGRQGVLMRVLAAFETSLSRMLVQLQAERESGVADVVAGVAHTLKSSSASVGALELSRACGEIEARLRSGDDSNLDRDIVRLIAEGEAALQAVGTILHP